MSIILETERLYFRPFERDDFNLLYKLDTDPDVRGHFPEGALSKEKIEEDLNRMIEDWKTLGYTDFAIFEKTSNQFVGLAGFAKYWDDVEIAYFLLKEYWGKGFATEATRGLLKWAEKNLTVSRIIALAPVDHIASQKVLEKIGMRYIKNEIYKESHGLESPGLECKLYEFILVKDRS